MVVGSICDFAEGAVRLQKRVFSLHDIAITFLMLGLVVTGVGVLHGVRVAVFGVSL